MIRPRVLAATLVLAACSRPEGAEASRAAEGASGLATRPNLSPAPTPAIVSVSKTPCSTPARGLLISTERLGPLRAGVPMAELQRDCPGDTTEIYSLGGIQGPARVFRFAGAVLRAVQFNCRSFDKVCSEQAPDFWEVSGDSVRLSDGAPLPKTVGELRARYGAGFVMDDRGGDDYEGVKVYLCRLPHMYFALSDSVHTTATVHPTPFATAGVIDSEQIETLQLWTPARDIVGFWEKTCQDAPPT